MRRRRSWGIVFTGGGPRPMVARRTSLPRAVTGLDWIIVAFTVLMAVGGFSPGPLARAPELAGFAGGAFLGPRLGPLLLEEGSQSPYAPLFALMGAVIVGGLLASGLEVLGFHLRHRLGERLGLVDGLGGSALVACLGLFLVWVGGSVALQTPGARDPQVTAAARSVVRVLGTACGLGVQGSGWVAGEGLVVTNAHVVAGQEDTTVQLGGEGANVDAEAVWFDPANDLAILRAPGVAGAPALSMNVTAEPGASAAVLGFPEDGPYDVQPARLGQTSTVISQDAYGRGPVRRTITSVRGLVRQGNSGGPVVDGRGRVVTTIFAAATSRRRTGYGVPDSLVRRALGRARGPVDTGPCA